MGDFLEDCLTSPEVAGRVDKRLPADWQPHVEERGDQATAVSRPFEKPCDNERDLIAAWQLDPDEWVIDGPVNCRRWMTYDERWLYYYKANLVRVRPGFERADVDKLCALAERRKPVDPPKAVGSGRELVVSMNDWQLGKVDQGHGTPETVGSLIASIDGVGRRLRELRKLGCPVDRVVLANTGDLTERTAGHYASQAFTVDLNEREQQRVARRLLDRLVDVAAPLASEVVVTSVPCNHGENRGAAGKAYTVPSDNLGHVIVESVEEACAKNPDRYGHVRFVYAEALTLVLPVAGVNVGMMHGHQVRGGGGSVKAVEDWWRGQVMGNQDIASADILLTAHRHHMQISEETGRTVIMAPASDGGSYWYTSQTGRSSPRGMLTVGVGDAYDARGWGDLAVL